MQHQKFLASFRLAIMGKSFFINRFRLPYMLLRREVLRVSLALVHLDQNVGNLK